MTEAENNLASVLEKEIGYATRRADEAPDLSHQKSYYAGFRDGLKKALKWYEEGRKA